MIVRECQKEKCFFYDNVCEAAYDGCMFGASIEDKEEERACSKNKKGLKNGENSDMMNT